MQNPDELGDYFIDGDFSAELENYLHFWKKKKRGMTMNVFSAAWPIPRSGVPRGSGCGGSSGVRRR